MNSHGVCVRSGLFGQEIHPCAPGCQEFVHSVAEQYSVLRIHHDLLVHGLVGGHLGCLHLGALTNEAALNTPGQVSGHTVSFLAHLDFFFFKKSLLVKSLPLSLLLYRMCENWKRCLGTIRGHQGASHPSASRQEQPKSTPGRGSAPAQAITVRKCSFTSNLNAPGYTARSLFLFCVPGGTSFCSLSNREVVKLKHVAIRPAAFSSSAIIQAPSPFIRGVFLEPLGLL